jgi:DNA-binding CsgD family transcriptional regulator
MDARSFRQREVVEIGLHPRLAEVFRMGISDLPSEYVAERYLNRSWSYGSHLRGWDRIPPVRTGALEASGAVDLFTIAAIMPDGRGCCFGAFHRRRRLMRRQALSDLPKIVRQLRLALWHRCELVEGAMGTNDDAARPLSEWPGRPSHAPLTRKEGIVLELLASGFDYGDIGARTGTTINTVRSHVRALYDKLGASNRAEAVNRAWQLGWLSSSAR